MLKSYSDFDKEHALERISAVEHRIANINNVPECFRPFIRLYLRYAIDEYTKHEAV
jgi:hypothetical protein